MPQIILASSSRYRQNLLRKLGLVFLACAPEIDETPEPGEAPQNLVTRLAEEKARAVAAQYPGALIIGSDQVAELDGRIVTKPHTHERAKAQLAAAQGRTLHFYTGLCLLDTGSHSVQVDCVPYTVTLRPLTDAQIEHYLMREQPYDCAGSFKAEGLGIALFSKLEGSDPNALTGLPLIRLVEMLATEGRDPLDPEVFIDN